MQRSRKLGAATSRFPLLIFHTDGCSPYWDHIGTSIRISFYQLASGNSRITAGLPSGSYLPINGEISDKEWKSEVSEVID